MRVSIQRLLLLLALALLTFVSLCGSAFAGRLYQPQYGTGLPAEAESIVGVQTGADGSMTPLTGSPFAAYAGPPFAVGGLYGLAFTPDGSHAASGFLFEGGVQGYSLSDGEITPVGPALTAASTTSIAVSPDGRFAYAPSRETGSGVDAYAIGADGSLTAAGSVHGFESYDLALTPDGRFLYAETTAGAIERFRVEADGSLASLGSTPITEPATLQISPDGRYLFVAQRGGSNDTLIALAIGADGSLTAVGSPVDIGGIGISYMAVSPDGRYVYVPDQAGKILAFAVAAGGGLEETGSLEAEDVQSIAVRPDGRFLYFTSDGEGIQVAAIGADGSLTRLPFSSTAFSGEPVRLVFQPQPTPQASFAATAGAAGTATSFDAGASTRAAHFDWDFGDGSTLADGGPTPTHAYAAPGVYTATLTVTDADGCSTAQIYTGVSTLCPGGAAATTSATETVPAAVVPPSAEAQPTPLPQRGARVGKTPKPRISNLKLTPRTFHVAAPDRDAADKGKSGTVLHYRLSTAAKVRFGFERRTLHGHHARFVKVGARKANGRKGANRLKFAGILHHKALRPGVYRVTVVATRSGRRSEPARTNFVIR